MKQPAANVNSYLTAIVTLYQASSKEKKSELLDHAELVTQLSRKQLIKRLSQLIHNAGKLPAKRSGRPSVYSKEELLPHIKYLWEQMERISGKRMQVGLMDWLPKYKSCPSHLRVQISKMSAATLERYLQSIRVTLEPKGLSTTCPARYMKNKVPINTLDAKVRMPGYTQTDTVSHCGDNAQGPFISSLTVTDIFTTWTENRAIFTKKGVEVKKQFKDIEKFLPFDLLAINSDSGSEFLNKDILSFTNHGTRVGFTRSRPYKKNDNCFVEQKNFTHVRELFGYERLDDKELVVLMNEIYTQYWNPLQNFFLPSFKLQEKVRVGSKVKKKYDKPKTPYQRVIESGVLRVAEIEALRRRKFELNPFELKIGLERKLKEFFDLARKRNIRQVA